MISILLMNFIILLICFVVLWGVSVIAHDASVVDIAWGPACALPAVLTWFLHEGATPRATVLTVLVAIWGLRLGIYLGRRNLGHGEDFRYVRMREKAGPNFPLTSLYKVFLFQLFLSFFVSLPTQVGQFGAQELLGGHSSALGVLSYVGILIFVIGISFEAIGDAQLRAFKKDPVNKGKLMDRGLWSWTRHPNYFGDSAVWTGLTLIALESQYGIFTVLSLAVMIGLLYNYSGKALLERSMSRRYPEYEGYKARVSGFFPKPPKSQ